MATVEFNLSGAGKIPAEHNAIAQAADKSSKSQEKLGETWKLTAKEAQNADRLMRDILKRNESEQDRYNRKLNDTKKALAGVKDETELLAKETTRLRVELLKSQDANPRLGAQRKRETEAAIADAKREAAEKVRLAKSASEELAAFDRKYTAGHKRNVEERIRDIQRSERAHAKFNTTLQQELAKLPALVDPMTKALGEWTDEGESLADAIKFVDKASDGAFGAAAISKMAAWGAGLVTAHEALQLISGEMQAQQELIDKKAATQMSVSESRNVLLRNLGSKSDAEIDQAQRFTEKLALETGVSEVAINAGMAEAVTASGGDVNAAREAVRMAAKFLPDRPFEIGEYAGSLMDLSKMTGTFDPYVNQGLQGLIGEVGRVVDPRMQARNIPEGLVNTLPYGGDSQTSGALFGAISNASADYTGTKTSTAIVTLAEQLSRYKPVKDLSTLNKRVAALQANPELAENFLRPGDEGGFGASFEAKSKGVIRQLLTDPKSFAAKEYAKNLPLFGDNERLAAVGRRSIEVLDRNKLNATSSLDRRLDATEEAIDLSSVQESLTTKQRTQLKKFAVASGRTSMGASFDDWLRGVVDGGDGETIRSGLASATQSRGRFLGGRPASELSPNESKVLEAMNKLIGEFKAQSKLIEEQNRIGNQQTGHLQKMSEAADRGEFSIPVSSQ